MTVANLELTDLPFVTATVGEAHSVDPTWSQRFIGHIENGKDSVTGSF